MKISILPISKAPLRDIRMIARMTQVAPDAQRCLATSFRMWNVRSSFPILPLVEEVDRVSALVNQKTYLEESDRTLSYNNEKMITNIPLRNMVPQDRRENSLKKAKMKIKFSKISHFRQLPWASMRKWRKARKLNSRRILIRSICLFVHNHRDSKKIKCAEYHFLIRASQMLMPKLVTLSLVNLIKNSTYKQARPQQTIIKI